jgi:DNA-binding NarL/FixJ family response regulator
MRCVTRIRVLLVDSNDDFLDGLTAWLAREADVEVVGTARTGEEAIQLADRLRPDLLLMDVSMSGMSGFEAAREIKSSPGAPTVVLTTFYQGEAVRHEAWVAGADGLIPKADVTSRVRSLVRDLVAGRIGTEAGDAAPRRRDHSRSATKEDPERDLSR